jgi:hypothetical protein
MRHRVRDGSGGKKRPSIRWTSTRHLIVGNFGSLAVHAHMYKHAVPAAIDSVCRLVEKERLGCLMVESRKRTIERA